MDVSMFAEDMHADIEYPFEEGEEEGPTRPKKKKPKRGKGNQTSEGQRTGKGGYPKGYWKGQAGGQLDRGEPAFSSDAVGMWALIIGAAFIAWLIFRSGSSSSGRSGDRSGGGTATSAGDAEALRRRRLEALSSSSTTTASATSDATSASKATEAAPTSAATTSSMPTSTSTATTSTTSAAAVASSAATSSGTTSELRQRSSAAKDGTEAPSSTSSSAAKTSKAQSDGPFAVQVRGVLGGSQKVKDISGLTASSTTTELQDRVFEAFGPEASGCRLRLFHLGKELKIAQNQIGTLGMGAGATVNVMFIGETQDQGFSASAKTTSEAPTVAEAKPRQAAPKAEKLTVRFQGALPGAATTAHVLEDITTATSVADLEENVHKVFAAGDNLRTRLFFMGKELKDASAYLGTVGLKPGSTLTIQVMFADGTSKASIPFKANQVSATAMAAAAGVVGNSLQEDTAGAIMAAAEAAGCNTAAVTQGQNQSSNSNETEVTPADAWRAMAGVEEQLSREYNYAEDASVRQASAMLRQLLTTATHGNNPGLMQMAKGALPDIDKIWNFQPTREHLVGLLASSAASAASSGGAASSSSGSGGADSLD
eukprot:TRINITY_DN11186_c0_g1_i1.p1 TRINITY_DN11186_c0_g1~~TRINITY_DN11186_c0_g1_i1.p1  ORF type:complete len:613 (+),score=164.78 TRINITY_DN11186_c0_g1_i1:51-1841(+)